MDAAIDIISVVFATLFVAGFIFFPVVCLIIILYYLTTTIKRKNAILLDDMRKRGIK